MASEENNSEDQADASHGPRECMPCRGSGQVISNLGGTPSNVACPWCGGSGVRVPGTDAQSHWPVADTASAGDESAPEVPAAEPAA